MMFSEEHAGHLFKPVARVEPATFSNQEVEMAMSKIEQAGMDAKALISSRSSPMTPEKAAIQGKETTVRVSEPASVSSIVEKFERATGAGPAESEECTEGKASAQLPPEESGSDAGDEGEETESEDRPVIEQDTSITETATVGHPSAREIQTLAAIKTVAIIQAMAIIYQVLSDLTETIEKTEAGTRLTAMQIQDTPPFEAEPEVINEIEEEEEVEKEIPESTPGIAQEAKGETVDQANIELGMNDEQADASAANSTDAPVDSTPAGEVASTQPAPETTENATDSKEEENLQQAVDEELEAKAMSKCTCGRCTIM